MLPGTDNRLVRAVAGAPATVRTKLLVAFLIIAALLVLIGVLGLRLLGQSNARVQQLGTLQLQSEVYQTCRPRPTSCSRSSSPGLGQSGGGIADRREGPARGGTPLDPARRRDSRLAVAALAGDDRGALEVRPASRRRGGAPKDPVRLPPGRRSDQSAEDARHRRRFQRTLAVAPPDGDRCQHRPVRLHERPRQSNGSEQFGADRRQPERYSSSRNLIITVSAVSVALALGLGLILSWALVGPIQRTESRLAEIAEGDFSGRLDVPNRDELGSLATNVNLMNEELRRLYGELETASRHKSEFLANMSHELRTPLNAIIGFSQVLRQRMFGEPNEKQEEYLDDILSSGNHLLSLINDVLDLSKVEAGQVELEVAGFSLREALERGVVMVRERAVKNGVQLSLELEPDVDLVRGDERRLRQASSTCSRTP